MRLIDYIPIVESVLSCSVVSVHDEKKGECMFSQKAVKTVVLAFFFLLVPALSWGGCWQHMGRIGQVSSMWEILQLQKYLKAGKCKYFAFSWSIAQQSDDSVTHTYVLYDGALNDLYRVVIQSSQGSYPQTHWEVWNNVPPEAILSAQPEEGLQFRSRIKGNGPVPLMIDAKRFLEENAPLAVFADSAF